MSLHYAKLGLDPRTCLKAFLKRNLKQQNQRQLINYFQFKNFYYFCDDDFIRALENKHYFDPNFHLHKGSCISCEQNGIRFGVVIDALIANDLPILAQELQKIENFYNGKPLNEVKTDDNQKPLHEMKSDDNQKLLDSVLVIPQQ